MNHIIGSSKLVYSTLRNRLVVAINCLAPASMATSTASQQKATLIFLHGLGDQGSSWHMQLAPMMPTNIKCICPTALNPNDPEDETGIVSASKKIHELIAEQEKQGVPHERIMLGGFSQGGALALYAAFTYPKSLAGVVALSGWLPLHEKVPSLASVSNKTTLPVLQCHGDSDCVVPLQWGTMTEQVLSKFLEKSNYEFKVYPGLAHSSSTAELNDVLGFVKKHLSK